MPSAFSVNLPRETAFTRRVLFAAEIIDAVTLEPVTKDIKVRATGLRNKPVINASGIFVWLEEGAARPLDVVVDASATQYIGATVAAPVPPKKSVRIELAPRYGYPFQTGVSALRGSLRESRFGTPERVQDAEVWLQWSDDAGWMDAPTRSTTAANGDFAVLLRLAPDQDPNPHPSGGWNVRLKVRRDGMTRTSADIPFQQGRINSAKEPFAWDELTP
ncbi:hypothetical protein [Mesorhizobium japonicum]|nr:hypothetical protein [Mesorhizobium japonicum]